MRPIRLSTHDAILEAALAVLAEKPGAALGEIAARAGVGRATLHRYFPSREHLLRELTLLSIAEIDEAVAGLERQVKSALELLERLIEAIVPLGDRFHFLSREGNQIGDEEIDAALQRQMDQLAALVEQVKDEGVIDPHVPTAWVTAVIDSLIYAAWSVTGDGSVAAKSTPALVLRTLLNGLGALATSTDESVSRTGARNA